MILYQKEIIEYLDLPSIPKKEWDGKKQFDKAVAVVKLVTGNDAFAVCGLNKEVNEPFIKKVFCSEPFVAIKNVYPIPDYMATIDDVDDMDLDNESKKSAKYILDEADLMGNGELNGDGESAYDEMPEWIFPEITNKDEAEAWLRQYNKTNKLRGSIPKSSETLKLRLYAIYKETNKK